MRNASRLSMTAGWAALALLGVLGLGGAAARPDGVSLGLPAPVPLALLAVAFVVLGAFARGSKGLAACLGLGLVPLLLLSGLHVPGLDAVSGRPLLALLLAGVAVVLSAAGRGLGRAAFLPCVVILYAGVAARVQLQVGPEGDEPHYLMVADSILRDADLSLEPDYAEGRYAAFYPKPLKPHYRVRGQNGEIFSLHALGLSLLILPAYALGGYPGASLFMAFLAALLAREIRELIRQHVSSEGLAEGMGWVVALSPPLIHYAGLVFTEIPAALVVAWALRWGHAPRASAPWGSLGVGSALAFLPWLNVRYAPLTVVLAVYVFAARPRLGVAARLALPCLVSALAIAAYHSWLYGFLDPRLVYGARPELSLASLPEGLQGLFLDQEFGLLAYAPLFALGLPGIVKLLRGHPRAGVVVAALISVVVVTAGSWHMWRGGWNPPARFLVPVLPALALAAAAWLRRGLGAGAALLVGWSLFTGLVGASEPRLVHRDRDGTAPLFREWSGAREWTRLLPAYVLSEPDRYSLALIWGGALVAAGMGWGGGRATARGLTLASAGLVAAAGAAGWVSDGQSEGRDAVRVLGRPALQVPGWRFWSEAEAEWDDRDLPWGPTYEPHRHPDGVPLAGRLGLPPGPYRLSIETESPPPSMGAPLLEVRFEGPGSLPRRRTFGLRPGGLVAAFDVPAGSRAVSLALRGGDPFLLRSIGLRRSTFPELASLNMDERGRE